MHKAALLDICRATVSERTERFSTTRTEKMTKSRDLVKVAAKKFSGIKQQHVWKPPK
jgi:hypothetical protein